MLLPWMLRIARQYWRAWIETAALQGAEDVRGRIARQYWRAWIETLPSSPGLVR